MNSHLFKKLNLPQYNNFDLGTFSTNYMHREACEIFNYYSSINLISSSIKKESEEIKKVCAEFIINLAGGTNINNYKYFNTSGSSEAIFLAVLLLKKYWQNNNITQEKPTLIVSSSSHVSWYKAAQYLDVDVKVIPINKKTLAIDLSLLSEAITNKTIGAICTLGATTTLVFDQIQSCDKILKEHYLKTNHFIPIHVDAASGGFIAPFVNNNFLWDFKLEHVMSINISSHKYGLVYPSLGWLFVKEQLFYKGFNHSNNYIGKPFKTFTLQFSCSAAHLFTQYYYIKELGYHGYKNVIQDLFTLKKQMIKHLMQLEEIEIILPENLNSLPGFLIKTKNKTNINNLSIALLKKGWKLPIYTLPEKNCKVGRIIIRYGFSKEHIYKLYNDIKAFFEKEIIIAPCPC